MKRINLALLLSFVMVFSLKATQQKAYTYESVPNDPLKARIYTLDNGLKIYLTVNPETPRIQTYIAVRVGGKNDPAENTGLAHYFEHLMFKGTEQFGTQNYAEEKKLLDQIEAQFEVYRKTSDETERKAIYQVIDSLSYAASKLAIPNEYTKLMSAIGAKGTNAYTGFDMTVYQEDIPSNQVENWAKIQADRFQNNVIRGFHTELETVYEEKNMSLTRDSWKIYEAMLATLFPHHPYGQQTILGTQDHLKNPSITRIKEYYRTWYVPNNMAICMSGDFNPDEVVSTIEKYFGNMKPNANLPKLPEAKPEPINQPLEKEVYGPDAESMSLAWRLPGISHPDYVGLSLLSRVLCNGKVGLIDVDLNQQQKTLSTSGYVHSMSDHSGLTMNGRPKEGQTLEQVKDLLLAEVEKLKKGEFNESILQATLNNYKLRELYQLEYNTARANMFVSSFVHGVKWENQVNFLERMSKLTKADIIALANKYLGNNYAVVYKRQGQDPNEKKIEKPSITPIVMNRDAVSPFLKSIQLSEVTPIEPVFLDFDKDLTKLKAQSNIPVLYKKNVMNGTFELMYVFDMGNFHDKALGLAFRYMRFLGTSDMTLEQLNAELYNLACSFGVYPGDERTYVMLSGLNENLPKALKLFEKLLADAQVNETAYKNLVADQLKSRGDAKLNQNQNFGRLYSYMMYGPKSPATYILSADEMNQIDPQELVDKIKQQNEYKHQIIYYGPSSEAEILAILQKYHRAPKQLKEIPEGIEMLPQLTTETQILIAPYEAKQIYMAQYSNRGEKFDVDTEPSRSLFNQYFGGGMSSIVFQEMREARGLAYSAWAGIISPHQLKYPYTVRTEIATQNDKMIEAIDTFKDIINNMPQSEAAFKLAKESIITRMRTDRITKSGVIWRYISAQDLGLDVDTRIKLFNDVQQMTLQDVVNYHNKWMKDRTYKYAILGDEKELDMEKLKEYGQIIRLTQEDIFGY
ncbi:MAG: insulinase family protein [Bacteroides sp.]|nr:insulinase family protein [Bacteroides sp.]